MEMIENILSEKNVKARLELITVRTVDEAIQHRHIGGPTIQINGIDIEPEARSLKRFGLS